MFDEEDREIGYALFVAIGMAILVSIFTIGIAAGSAIGGLGQKSARAALPVTAGDANPQSMKPVETTGGADAREARRVEVTLR
jgi:hypothetical protein